MSEAPDRQQLITSLTNAGKAMKLLAKDDTTFRAALDAFRAADQDSFQRLLDRFKIVDCELICFWLRSTSRSRRSLFSEASYNSKTRASY